MKRIIRTPINRADCGYGRCLRWAADPRLDPVEGAKRDLATILPVERPTEGIRDAEGGDRRSCVHCPVVRTALEFQDAVRQDMIYIAAIFERAADVVDRKFF